jgi:hypothetical protein
MISVHSSEKSATPKSAVEFVHRLNAHLLMKSIPDGSRSRRSISTSPPFTATSSGTATHWQQSLFIRFVRGAQEQCKSACLHIFPVSIYIFLQSAPSFSRHPHKYVSFYSHQDGSDGRLQHGIVVEALSIERLFQGARMREAAWSEILAARG